MGTGSIRYSKKFIAGSGINQSGSTTLVLFAAIPRVRTSFLSIIFEAYDGAGPKFGSVNFVSGSDRNGSALQCCFLNLVIPELPVGRGSEHYFYTFTKIKFSY